MLVGETALLLVSLSFVKEREQGTLDQLRITGVRLGSMVAGKLVASIAISLATACTVTALMRMLFGVAIHGSFWVYAAAVCACVPPSLGLGLILTAEARNQAQALHLTFLVWLPSIMLSGFIFPRNNMPQGLQWFSMLLPTTWSVQLVRGVVLRGANWTDLWSEFAVLLALGAGYLAAGAWHLNRRLR